MRLTTVILIASLMQLSAATFGQRISLNQRNTSLKSVLREMTRQSGFGFFYDSKVIRDNQKVNVKLSNVELDEALGCVLSGLKLTYSIDGKIVSIKKVEEPSFFEHLVAKFRAINVRGKVLDEKGQPMMGATVGIKGKNRSVKTDQSGAFYLDNVEVSDKLVISYIGYQTREVNVTSDMGSLTMIVADSKLEEVTINAGYYTVKDSERTGSISRITSKDIEKQPVNNVLATLQGRLAGVNITQTTGTPGGGFNIQIRGINSLRSEGNAPLYIIDGVPYSAESIGYSPSNTIHPTPTSPLNNLNPGDIESLEVLKDADATAIYGSRGANGVILVTTKKGKVGKVTHTANMSKGFGKVTRFLKLMNTQQYLEMRAEAFANDGLASYPSFAYDINGTWDHNRYTDWQKELLGGTAEITNINSSLSGGSEHTQFMISGNYNKETTIFPGDFAYGKGNIRSSLNHTSSDRKFNINFSAGYTLQDNDQPSQDLTPAAWSTPPNAPALYNEKGELNWEENTFENPLVVLNGKSLAKSGDLVSNMILSYQMPWGFETKVNLGYTSLNHKESSTFPSTIYNPSYGFGPDFSSVVVNQTARQSWIVEPQLNWKKEFGKTGLEFLVGSTFQKQTNDQLAQLGSGFPSNNLIYNLAAASYSQIMLDNESVYKYQAIFGRANLNWDKRFFVNFTGRRDGSSRFGPGRQFANFGAIGAAWLFTNEQWMQESTLISFGKLRASYGTT